MAEKLKSRKFIIAVLSAIGGIAISLSQLGGKWAVICAVISAVIPAVTYIITEGVIDAKAVDLTAEAAKQIITIVKDKDGYFTFSRAAQMMTKQEFIKSHLGKACDYDGVAGVQCVDLIKFYLRDCFGISPGSWGNAKEYWYHTQPILLSYFKKIPNTPDFIPQYGDICIFDGEYGHICIGASAINGGIRTKSGTTSFFYSFDQNYNNTKACTLTKHSYKNFLGVLRPKYWCAEVDLNIRAGAGTNYDVVGLMKKATIKQVISYKGNWAKIGDNEYVSINYLD